MCKAFSLATPIPAGGITRDQRMHEHGPDGGGNQRWHPGQANQPRRALHKIRPGGHKSMLVQTNLIRNGTDRADTPPLAKHVTNGFTRHATHIPQVGANSGPNRSPHRRWLDGPNGQMVRVASGTEDRGTLRPLSKRHALVADACPPPLPILVQFCWAESGSSRCFQLFMVARRPSLLAALALQWLGHRPNRQ